MIGFGLMAYCFLPESPDLDSCKEFAFYNVLCCDVSRCIFRGKMLVHIQVLIFKSLITLYICVCLCITQLDGWFIYTAVLRLWNIQHLSR